MVKRTIEYGGIRTHGGLFLSVDDKGAVMCALLCDSPILIVHFAQSWRRACCSQVKQMDSRTVWTVVDGPFGQLALASLIAACAPDVSFVWCCWQVRSTSATSATGT